MSFEEFIVVEVKCDLSRLYQGSLDLHEIIDNISFVEFFDDELSANVYIKNQREKEEHERNARKEYIDKWVDKLVVPENLSHSEWRTYQAKYFGEDRYVVPEFFKKELKYFLYRQKFQEEGFDPPEITVHNSFGLFVAKGRKIENLI